MRIRNATLSDVAAMSDVLRDIIAQTGRERPSDAAFVTGQYVANPDRIACFVAVDAADVAVGFQSLVRAVAGNRYEVPAGWGIIGTHISPRAHRQGVGAALFAATRQAARAAGIAQIDAYIGADNPGGLRYYDAMGFRTYREPDGIVQKVYDMGGRRAA